MNPLMRLVIAPRAATWSTLAETNALRPTNRSMASPMTARFRPATSTAAPLASAARAPWSAITREAAPSESVARRPSATKLSSSPTSRRMPWEASARERRRRIGHPRRGGDLLPVCSTVPSSGRRSSAMWIAVAIWVPSVLSAVRSFEPYV